MHIFYYYRGERKLFVLPSSLLYRGLYIKVPLCSTNQNDTSEILTEYKTGKITNDISDEKSKNSIPEERDGVNRMRLNTEGKMVNKQLVYKVNLCYRCVPIWHYSI